MSVDFASLLTTEQKRSLIESRVAQFAAEAYQYSLNKKTAEALDKPDQVEAIQSSLAIIEAAIQVHQDELKSLPTE